MARKGNQNRWLYRLTHPQHRKQLFLIFNLIIVISTIVITVIDIIYGTSDGQNGFNIQGWNYFMPFTINSNVLMAIVSTIVLAKNFKNRHNSTDTIYGRKLTNFYCMATVCFSLT